MWKDDEFESLDDCESDGGDDEDGDDGESDVSEAEAVLGHRPTVCNICHEEVYGAWEFCEDCSAFVCLKCAVPALDKHGNMVVLCADCAKPHNEQ